MKTKACSKCRIEKSTSEFNSNISRKDLLEIYCKVCKRHLRQESYARNKETTNKHHREFYIENRERILERKYLYRKNNKDIVAIQQHQYYIRNKEMILKRGKLYWFKYYMDNLKRIRELGKKYREKNKKRVADYALKYYLANRDVILCKSKARQKWRVENLSEAYIIQILKKQGLDLHKDEIPKEVLETKRAVIQAKRFMGKR